MKNEKEWERGHPRGWLEWKCDTVMGGWLTIQRKRKKAISKDVLLDKLKKERKQATTTLDLQWAWKKREEIASRQICSEEIDNGKAARRYDNKTIARQPRDTATRQWVFYYGILVIMQFCEDILGVSYLKKLWNEIADLSSKPTILKKLRSAAFRKRAFWSFSKTQIFKIAKPNAIQKRTFLFREHGTKQTLKKIPLSGFPTVEVGVRAEPCKSCIHSPSLPP